MRQWPGVISRNRPPRTRGLASCGRGKVLVPRSGVTPPGQGIPSVSPGHEDFAPNAATIEFRPKNRRQRARNQGICVAGAKSSCPGDTHRDALPVLRDPDRGTKTLPRPHEIRLLPTIRPLKLLPIGHEDFAPATRETHAGTPLPADPRPVRWRGAVAVAIAWVTLALSARAAGPADELLQLAAPDAGVALLVEDLTGNLDGFLQTPLARGLRSLPAVRAWRESGGGRDFAKARGEIEAALHADARRIADDLLGQAVVLALYLPPGEPPDRARGLFLTKVKDRDLLLRLLREFDDSDRKAGTLVESATRRHGGEPYTVRTFRPGTKPTEYLAILGGQTLAWSNAEELIRGAIDRSKPGAARGLGDSAGLRAVREGLPGHPAASLFVDPRFLERLITADARARTPEEERPLALARRYLATLTYAGAALAWRDGPALHVHQVIDPAKAAEPLRRWAAGGGPAAGAAPRVPASALAVATASMDFSAALDLAMGLIPEAERPRADHVLAVLRGLLLGKDLRAEVLPKLGPGLLFYVDAPTAPGRWPWVAATPADAEVGPAIENALRTALSLYSLGPAGKDRPAAVESRDAPGATVTGLAGTRFAYAVGGGQVAVGSSPEAVVAHLAAQTRGTSPATTPFERTRMACFPRADTFAFVDLDALHRVASARREGLARALAARRGAGATETDARRDLDQALALIGLFRAAYFTAAVDPRLASAHHTLGLLPRGAGPGSGH